MKISTFVVTVVFSLMLAGSPLAISQQPQAPSGDRTHVPDAGKNVSQEDKARACNKAAEAKNLKGTDRKTFIQNCMNGQRQ